MNQNRLVSLTFVVIKCNDAVNQSTRWHVMRLYDMIRHYLFIFSYLDCRLVGIWYDMVWYDLICCREGAKEEDPISTLFLSFSLTLSPYLSLSVNLFLSLYLTPSLSFSLSLSLSLTSYLVLFYSSLVPSLLFFIRKHPYSPINSSVRSRVDESSY